MALLDFTLEAGMSSSLKRSVSSMENLKSLCEGGMKRVSRCYNLSQMDQPEDNDAEEDNLDTTFDSGFNIEADTIASPDCAQHPGPPPIEKQESGSQTPVQVSPKSKPKPRLTNRESISILPQYIVTHEATSSPPQEALSFLRENNEYSPKYDLTGRARTQSGGLSMMFKGGVNIS
jgi:hypothetical protein